MPKPAFARDPFSGGMTSFEARPYSSRQRGFSKYTAQAFDLRSFLGNLDFRAPQSSGPGEFEAVFSKHSIQEVLALSSRLFPGSVTCEYTSDPEDESHEYLVFDVVAHGEYAAYRERIFEWYDEVEKIIPDRQGRYRLIVHPER